jgi:hypothetical protein
MASREILFFNHFHTERSTEYVDEERDVPEWDGSNHFGSPVKTLKYLDKGQKAVVTITEHFWTNGKDFFEELGGETEELGGSYEMNERCLILEEGGATLYIINGVEASYREEDNHLVLAGLPLSDRERYKDLDREELREKLEEAGYAHPAHPFLENFGMEDEILDEVCETINYSPTELFIPFTTAYGSIIDGKARGEEESERDVKELAGEHGANLIVELDHHVHLPRNLNGVALLENSAAGKLENGEIPLEEIRDSYVIDATHWDLFKDWFRAARTFADQLPNYMEWKSFWSLLTFPYGDEELLELRDYYYDAELSSLDIEKLRSRSRPLNN